MANWRLVFNAICLPVLSYGCQLWANSRKYKTLVKTVQGVFNEGVKVISGAFCTAPREALHEITRVLPAQHYLEKLMATSALRLYRVPITSQLRRRLSPDWCLDPSGGPDLSNEGPVIPIQRAGTRVRAQCPTALEALGERVPVQGLHADVVAVAPWEVPNWRARVNHMGITTPQDCKAWVNDLYGSLPASGASIISVAGTVSNKDRYDDWMVGGVAAVLNAHTEGITRTWTHHWALGMEVMQYNVDLFTLAKAAQWAAEFYETREPPSHIYILSCSQAALTAITNIRNTTNQVSVLLFHSSLTALCSRHRDVGITLTWSPVEWSRVSDNTARLRPFRHAASPPSPHSIKSSLLHTKSGWLGNVPLPDGPRNGRTNAENTAPACGKSPLRTNMRSPSPLMATTTPCGRRPRKPHTRTAYTPPHGTPHPLHYAWL